jgi:hypothetical protein
MEPLFSLASERPLSGLLQHPAPKSATVLRATGLSYEAVSRPKKSILFAGRKSSGGLIDYGSDAHPRRTNHSSINEGGADS